MNQQIGTAASETEKGLAMGCYTEPTWNVGERLGGQRLFFILQNIYRYVKYLLLHRKEWNLQDTAVHSLLCQLEGITFTTQ